MSTTSYFPAIWLYAGLVDKNFLGYTARYFLKLVGRKPDGEAGIAVKGCIKDQNQSFASFYSNSLFKVDG